MESGDDLENSIITVDSVSQCGDVFLMKFKCPDCFSEQFSSDGAFVCGCGFNFRSCVFDIEKARRVLVVGTMRKNTFSNKLIRKMYDEQDRKCAYCFSYLNNSYHVEHIKPLCVGGTNKKDNLCLSCKTCNAIAGSMVFDDFFEKQKYILNKRSSKRNK